MDKVYSKIGTNIEGLDRLLYGGLDMKEGVHTIFIRGGQDSERSLLGMQMLYGLTQSLYKLKIETSTPQYFSTYLTSAYMNDVLLDTFIAQTIKELMVMYVNKPEDTRDDIASIMTRLFFEPEDEDIKKKKAYAEVVSNRILNLILNRADYLLGKEVLYYSNRTNSIHLRSARHPLDIHADSDFNNLLFKRNDKFICDYFENISGDKEADKKTDKKTDKETDQKVDKKAEKEAINHFNSFFKLPFVNIRFAECGIEEVKKQTILAENAKHLIAFDIDEGQDVKEVSGLIEDSVKPLREHKESSVLIFVLPKDLAVPEYLADMIIDLKTKYEDTYIYKYLSIIKSRRQTTVLGYHQYKRRDYGIAVYPGLQTYFEQRRYLQRAMVYTHSSVLEETYQQYIDRKKNDKNVKTGYQDYMSNRSNVEKSNFDALYPKYDQGMSSVDILDKIMLSQSPVYKKPSHQSDHILGYQGCVTAIIGVPNTYKRFLTFGSIFSSALNDEHTLIMMLNKDDSWIKRRLSCPARAGRDANHPRCLECYRKIHLMNICMGNITPDELIHYLNQQLDTNYQDGEKIKRLVIDDLQIIDYCFPLLERNKMFLPALTSVCRDRGIWLYILCDKNCRLVDSLRVVSDNIVCTNRDSKGTLQTYIERFTGYQNTPSKIYSCDIKNVKDLFECYEKINEDDNEVSLFELNSKCVESKSLFTTETYWK